jgi:VanZ family protein
MDVTLVLRPALWAPPIALMALIYFLSDQPDLSSGLGLIDTIGRKLIHAGEYGLLCFLWWRALRAEAGSDRAVVAAVLITIAYAVTDELHQTTVEGRHGSPVDVLIDGAGAAVAALLVRRRA